MKTMILGLMVLTVLAGCSQSATGGGPAWTPTVDELKNLTYSGVTEEPVTLSSGKWEGKPPVEGSSSRPSVNFVGDFVVTGDLDGQGGEEAVVLLGSNSGGTGEYIFLAVVGDRDGKPVNLATEKLGDRVQVVKAEVFAGDPARLEVLVLQSGPDDAACCPGELVTRAWTLGSEGLEALNVIAVVRRLSLDILAGQEWVLRAWDRDEPALAEPEVTLTYADGRFSGNNGCNNYFAGAEDGDSPGELTIGMVGATKMFCPDPAGAIELRFEQLLGSVTRYGFMAGQLMLAYEYEGHFGMMLFEGRQTKDSD